MRGSWTERCLGRLFSGGMEYTGKRAKSCSESTARCVPSVGFARDRRQALLTVAWTPTSPRILAVGAGRGQGCSQ